MRILIIHNYYQQFGGTDAVVNHEAELLKHHGHEVSMFTRHNNEIKEFGLREKVSFFRNTIYSRSSATKLNQAIDEFRPDLAYIHAVQPLISYSCYDVLQERNIPAVQMLHDFRFLCPAAFCYIKHSICEKCAQGNYRHAVWNKCYRSSYMLSLLYATAISNARNRLMVLDKIDKFICPTQFFKEKFMDIGIPSEKLLIKPHFIESESITPSYSSGSYILYLGRLSEEKGLMTLLKAMKALPNLTLKVMGTGPFESTMQKYIENNKMVNVDFLGFRTGSSKYDAIRGSCFTVMPSVWNETFGLTALDSFACGKPVVASRIGSLPFVVQDGETGILFQAGNTEDLTKTITSLYEDPTLSVRMGRKARQIQEQQFSTEQSYSRLIEIFHEAIK